ncbi:MAG: hypothetical protein NW216_08230 [Hyphomicrobium sp.]|nr:hypothetical protein [Hyphomicrobium sp.]
MGIAEQAGQLFINTVLEMTPNLEELYCSAHTQSLWYWRMTSRGAVTVSGAAAVAIPGPHIPILVSEVAFLMNRLGAASFGVGAIKSQKPGLGNVLETEDFACILAYWAKDDDVKQAMTGKLAADATTKVGLKVGTKLYGKGFAKVATKTALSSAGYLVGNKVGGKVLAKAGALFGSQVAAKAGTGFAPVIGAVAGAGINYWIMSGVIEAADQFYEDKLALIQTVSSNDDNGS